MSPSPDSFQAQFNFFFKLIFSLPPPPLLEFLSLSIFRKSPVSSCPSSFSSSSQQSFSDLKSCSLLSVFFIQYLHGQQPNLQLWLVRMGYTMVSAWNIGPRAKNYELGFLGPSMNFTACMEVETELSLSYSRPFEKPWREGTVIKITDSVHSTRRALLFHFEVQLSWFLHVSFPNLPLTLFTRQVSK